MEESPALLFCYWLSVGAFVSCVVVTGHFLDIDWKVCKSLLV